ncbi:hypothetical protein K502DRAFT_366685 [Neoconidiobolus thromboides FSU 785]|nr:hypothetical protein K502DRAFT_366685 [Neoconidiobolus thromboides FSU 785]
MLLFFILLNVVFNLIHSKEHPFMNKNDHEVIKESFTLLNKAPVHINIEPKGKESDNDSLIDFDLNVHMRSKLYNRLKKSFKLNKYKNKKMKETPIKGKHRYFNSFNKLLFAIDDILDDEAK